jgi:hypothetical protein
MSKLRDFSQLPNILFDMDLLSEDSYLVGFLRFWRHYATRKENFRGSYRKLANLIRMPKSCVARMVPEWERAGFVTKETKTKQGENREEMVLTINVEAFWEFNYAYYPERPKLGQQNIIIPSNISSENNSVPWWDVTVPPRDNIVPDWDKSVPRASSNSDVILGNTTVISGNTEVTNSRVSIDNAALSQLQNKNASLEAQLEQALKQINVMRNALPNTPDTPLTPAGSITVPLGGNSQETPTDHNALESPAIDGKQGLAQESPVVAHQEKETPEIAPQCEEMPSSTQAVESSTNQATGDDPIATSATKNRGRSKSAGKEEKPARSKKEITGSPEAIEIVNMYISLFKHPIPLTQGMIDEAEKLVPCHPTSEDINGCRLWCYASNPEWYGTNGKTHGRVTMKDIVNNWAGWVASQEAPSTDFQIPDALKDRVAGVYAALNEWRAAKTGDPENVFVPDAESDQAICNLLQKGKRPTKKRMNTVCEAIWETPRNTKTGYLLREHMTVKMICLTYRERELDISAKEQEAQGPKNIVDLFDANRTFGNGLTYLPGALPIIAKSSIVMEG